MRVVVTGGGGFLGHRLVRALLALDGIEVRPGRVESISEIVVADIQAVAGSEPDDARLVRVQGDVSSAAFIDELVDADTGLVCHLAAIVSGQAEQDFELGMQINLHATMALLERCRGLGHCPRLLFSSSVAVYGGAMPAVLNDDTLPRPQSSYGAQKLAGETLVNDYSRKGFIDGRSLRLPTVVVRPGKPNAAASSFLSGIIREPLNHQQALCPVSPDTGVWIMSPRTVIANLVHACSLDAGLFGADRTVALPGLSTSVTEMLDALRAVAGADVVDRVKFEHDAFTARIVGGWPSRFSPGRALDLGFSADPEVASIIRAYIEDDLPGSS